MHCHPSNVCDLELRNLCPFEVVVALLCCDLNS
jgi:hypothetical protein